jgi:hypothetical protein
MVEISSPSLDLYLWPLVTYRMAIETAMGASISIAKIIQIATQSADTALTKYIELTEQELRRSQHKEKIKVE